MTAESDPRPQSDHAIGPDPDETPKSADVDWSASAVSPPEAAPAAQTPDPPGTSPTRTSPGDTASTVEESDSDSMLQPVTHPEPDPEVQAGQPATGSTGDVTEASAEAPEATPEPDQASTGKQPSQDSVPRGGPPTPEPPDDTETTQLMPKFAKDQNDQVTPPLPGQPPPSTRRQPGAGRPVRNLGAARPVLPPRLPPDQRLPQSPLMQPPVMPPPYSMSPSVRPPVGPVPPPRRWPSAGQLPARSVVANQPYAAVDATPASVPAPEHAGLSAALHKSADALSLSKVLAGGMAAATSAVFGSYFGTFGTVGGAAVGSVATTVVTRMFQKSIERTQSTVVSTVKHVVGVDGESGDDKPDSTLGQPSTAQPAARKSLDDVATVRLSPEQQAEVKKRGRRSLKVLLAGTFMIFLLALALVTGIEWAKGSPLSGGGGGTSIGHVLDPHAVRPTPVQQLPSNTDLSGSELPSDDNSESEDPSDENSSRHHHRHSRSDSDSNSDSDSGDSDNSDRRGSGDNTETTQPNHGGLLGGLTGQ